jgi:hypothetical protein
VEQPEGPGKICKHDSKQGTQGTDAKNLETVLAAAPGLDEGAVGTAMPWKHAGDKN